MAEMGRKFFVLVEGVETGAQRRLVEMVKNIGQTAVSSPEECDYFLLFCPVVSRVAADIRGALDKVPDNKPVILVVLHHTSNRYLVLAESSRHVHDPNVMLTVDFLFWNEDLHNCFHNDESWKQIQSLLGHSSQSTGFQNIKEWLKKPVTLSILGGVIVIAIVVVIIIVFTR